MVCASCLLAYCRYNLLVKEWKKKCTIAKENFQNCEDKISSIKKSGITTAQRLRIGGVGVRHIEQVQIIYANISLLYTLAMKHLN